MYFLRGEYPIYTLNNFPAPHSYKIVYTPVHELLSFISSILTVVVVIVYQPTLWALNYCLALSLVTIYIATYITHCHCFAFRLDKTGICGASSDCEKLFPTRKYLNISVGMISHGKCVEQFFYITDVLE